MENTVNSRVMLLKKELNLTIDEFAKRANLSRTTVWSIQNGVEMKPKTIRAISEAFNINMDWLLHGKGKMFLDKPKEVETSNPWKDEAYATLKKENERLWQMVQHFMSGAKPNFLKAFEQASIAKYFPAKYPSIGSGADLRYTA